MSKFEMSFYNIILLNIFGLVSAYTQQPLQSSLDCVGLKISSAPGTKIIAYHNSEVYNYSLAWYTGLNFCNVSIQFTHPGANDVVLVAVWLPLEDWNGRFQGTGGGGLYAGIFDTMLAPAVDLGYAGASTDAGLAKNGTIDPGSGAWILKSDGTVDIDLVVNFNHRAAHDMAVIGKAVTKAFYGKSPKYSYWNGCSTGGRQGYSEAQRYPLDFDGILANAPANFYSRLVLADFWPSIVLANVKSPPQCVFEAFRNDTIAMCDALDGVEDGFISDPSICHYDPQLLVGSIVECGMLGNVTITPEDATVVVMILEGAKSTTGEQLWFGIPPGASFDGLANTTVYSNGSVLPVPFSAPEFWIRYFIYQDPEFETLQMTFHDFQIAFALSVAKYAVIFGSEDPDLTEFGKSGGKLLSWHGLADQYISPEGTIKFRKEVERLADSSEIVDDYYRLFLAPGVAHCVGNGPAPVDPLSALVDWVERGLAPDTLPASVTKPSGTIVKRDICRYPLISKYNGYGDPNNSGSFTCI
ncbi:feruloyl esterase b [Phlyctema vagabunda]|uniref:Carboxylic ester hydrolase n=1 Tax=Phlyctema vagabunda TaxID=108571 RepID=A0ABR4P7M4_9HELO